MLFTRVGLSFTLALPIAVITIAVVGYAKVMNKIDDLEQHNKLAKDFERLKSGLILEESLKEWRKRKVSDRLFKGLDIDFPCKANCPFELMKALSRKLEENILEIGILPTELMHPKLLYKLILSSCITETPAKNTTMVQLESLSISQTISTKSDQRK